jgi:hypothetical protein
MIAPKMLHTAFCKTVRLLPSIEYRVDTPGKIAIRSGTSQQAALVSQFVSPTTEVEAVLL